MLKRWLARLRSVGGAPRPREAALQVIEAYRARGLEGAQQAAARLAVAPLRPVDLLRRAANAAIDGGDPGSAVALAPLAHASDPSNAMLRWLCLVEARAGLLTRPAERLAEAKQVALRDGAEAREWRQLLGYARMRSAPPKLPPQALPASNQELSRVLLWAAAQPNDPATAAAARLAAALAAAGYPPVQARPPVEAGDGAGKAVEPGVAIVGGPELLAMPPDECFEAQARALQAFVAKRGLHLVVSDGDLHCAWPALTAARRSGMGFVAWFSRPLAPAPAYAGDERSRLLRNLECQVLQHADAVLAANDAVAASLEKAGAPLNRVLRLGTDDTAAMAITLQALLRAQFDRMQQRALPPSASAHAAERVIDTAGTTGPWESLVLEKGRSILLRAPVAPGQALRLSIDARAPGHERPKGVLAEVRYLDDQGALLPAPYPDCSASDRRPAYFYVAVQPPTVHGAFRKRLTVPAGAGRIEVRYSLFDQGEPPIVRRAPGASLGATTGGVWAIQVLQPSRAFVTAVRPLQGYAAFISAAVASLEGAGSPKAVVAEVRLFDAAGKRLQVKVPGLAASPRHGHYAYLPSVPESQAEPLCHVFEPPADVARIELHLFANGADVKLLQRPTIQVFDTGAIERLLAAGATGDWLGHAAQLAQREGALSLLERVLSTWVRASGGKPEVVQRWRVLQSEREELQPDWYPQLAGRVAARAQPGRLTVCHLHKTAYPYENTGGSIRCLNTVKSQLAIGLDAYVITPPGYPASGGIQGAPLHEQIEGVDHFRIGPGTSGVKALLPTERTRLAALQSALWLRRRGVSLIHAASGVRGYELAVQAFALRDLFDVPVIYEVRSFHEHTWAPADPRIQELERTQSRIEKENRCMALADHVVTISDSMRSILVERGVPPQKIDVIPNAIDIGRFEGTVTPVALPALEGADLVVGYVSNMSKREGHRHLLEAVALLRAGGLDARCLLVGDGSERAALERQAQTLGLADVTVFAGEVDHTGINAYYMAIDVFVVPRIPDYAADWVTPLKPYEAMALGRPLVVTDLPALREVVGDGERGRLARPADSESLYQEILALARAPEQRRAMAEGARAWVFEHRTWAANAQRYKAVYERVLAQYAGRKAAMTTE